MATSLDRIFLYRMTHIHNISHIFANGLTHITSPNSNPSYQPIGDPSLINTRSQTTLPSVNSLGDYIPFYFYTRMPMLFVIQNGYNGLNPVMPSEIVYCVSSVKDIIDTGLDFAFTDGHAVNSMSLCYDPSRVNEIENLIDFDAIKNRYWKSDEDLDLKRRKEAEFLVLGDIPPSAIRGYIVFDDNTKNKLQQLGVSSNRIKVSPNSYF